MLCLLCWWMRKGLEKVWVTIKFLFSYSSLGTLFRWKKKSWHYSANFATALPKKGCITPSHFRKELPWHRHIVTGMPEEMFFPCLMFRTRTDATTQAWIWVWLIERDAVPFFKLTLAHSELEFVLWWCKYNCAGTEPFHSHHHCAYSCSWCYCHICCFVFALSIECSEKYDHYINLLLQVIILLVLFPLATWAFLCSYPSNFYIFFILPELSVFLDLLEL